MALTVVGTIAAFMWYWSNPPERFGVNLILRAVSWVVTFNALGAAALYVVGVRSQPF